MACVVAVVLGAQSASAQGVATYDAFLRQVVLTRTGGYGHPRGISYRATDSTTVRLLGNNDSLPVFAPPAPNSIECPTKPSTDGGKSAGGYLITVSDEPTREAGVRRVSVALSCTNSRWDGPPRFGESGVWDVIHDASGWRVLRQISRRMT